MRDLKYAITTLEAVTATINLAEEVAIDVETSGFYGEIQLVQFYQRGWPEALLVPKPEIITLSCLLTQLKMVCHNTAYEVSTIQTQLGALLDRPNMPWCPSEWHDTLLLSKLRYFDKEKYSLDECYLHAFKVDPYLAHGIDKKAMQKTDWSKLTPEKETYAALDVFYLLDLFDDCTSWIDSVAYKLDIAATTRAFQFQTNGLPVNEERVHQLMAKNQAEIDKVGLTINVNSWQQVRPYIGEDESDGLALATFALEGNQRAADVNKVRKLTKQQSFLQKFLDTQYEGRIYGKFSFTTKSGRGNCKDQNLQQLPRKTKEVFEAGEGNVFVMSDFAQLELRYGCAFINEPAMEKLFRNGDDLHQYTADMMAVPRQDAKTCNFNLLYLGSANMLRSIFISQCDKLLPVTQVRTMKNSWHKLWEAITKWQDQVIDDWRNGKPQVTTLGRKFKSKLYTDAANLPISGGSADIAKLAMHRMFEALDNDPELKEVTKFCNFIHDSFMWECPDDPRYYEPLARLTLDAMKTAWYELVLLTKIPDLPMPVDVLVGKNWGDIEYGQETPVYKLTE